MKVNKGFVQQLFGVLYLMLVLGLGFGPTKVPTIAWLTASDALVAVLTPTEMRSGHGNNAGGAPVEAPLQTGRSNNGGDNVRKTPVDSEPPGQKGDVDNVKTPHVEAPLAIGGHNGDRARREKACGDGTNEAVSGKEDDHVFPSAASTQREEKRRQQHRQCLEYGTLKKTPSLSSISCDDNVDRSVSLEASTIAAEDAQLESSPSSCKRPSRRITRRGTLSKQHRKGAEPFSSEGSSGASAARSAPSPPAVYAAARAITSHISTLMSRLQTRHYLPADVQTRSMTKFSSLLNKPIKHFLPSSPRRRSGLLQPIGYQSESGASVLRYLADIFPLTIKSAFHKGSTQLLVINPQCPILHTRGRISVCVEFRPDRNAPPLHLTVLFVEDKMPLGQDVVRVLNRVAVAQQVAMKAGLPRPVDVATHFRIGTPLDVVPISKNGIIVLGSAVVVGKAILEPRMWAPLSTVLLRMDQAAGRKDARIANQARIILTGQVVEAVSLIRSKKIVLPRITLGDFWLDSDGMLLSELHRVTDVLTEKGMIGPSRATGKVRASQGTLGEASNIAESNASQGLDERSNSVSLALLIMEMWCRLAPEQMRARTPAQETAARQITLDFSRCLPSFPPEVKDLVTLLHGGIGQPSIPVAEVVFSKPFKVLVEKMGRMEELERQAQRNREDARRSRKAASTNAPVSLKLRVPSVLYNHLKRTALETGPFGGVKNPQLL